MMFDFGLILDVLFLLVAIYLFPGVPPQEQLAPLASTPSTPLPAQYDTPLPSPAPFLHPSAPVPRVVLHPSHASSSAIPVAASLTPRPNHKRKSVSFSISSINDLLKAPSSKGELRQHRPPTPWMKGPASPSELLSAGGSPMPSPMAGSGKGSLGVMVQGADQRGDEEDAGEEMPLLSPKICSRDVVDAMGIKKAWMMS